jgi:predicted nucleic acid-binding protein
MESIITQYVSVDSKLLESVITLGDQCRATVGFFPRGAFAEAAKRKQIICLLCDGDFAGHVVFRFSYGNQKLTIVQLCISPNFRGKHLAHALVNFLDITYPNVSVIELNCRRDYKLEDVWRKLGFTPVLQKRGRAQNGSELVTWRIQHDQANLLNLIDIYERNEKLIAVLDTNIVIDLYDEATNESSALLSDYMVMDVAYRITSDVNEEINKHKDSQHRKALLAYSSNFHMIDVYREDNYKELVSILQNEFDKSNSHEKDISHIAQSIIGEADVFITRDEWLISQSIEILQKFKLRIIGPAEFISQIDTLEQAQSYSPLKIACTELEFRKFQWTDIADVEKLFSYTNNYKKQGEFRKFLRLILSTPKEYNAIVIQKEETIVGFYSIKEVSQEAFDINSFLINTSKLSIQLSNTLARYLIMRIIQEYSKKTRILSINSMIIKDALHPAFIACGFLIYENEMYKTFLEGMLDKETIIETLQSFTCYKSNFATELISHLENFIADNRLVQIEKLLWPLKYKDIKIPTYIIPIQANYAIQLFGDLQPRLVPYDNAEPSLSIENIYFRSPKPIKLDYPAHILWYVSDDTRRIASYQKHIVAISLLDFVDVGSAKEIFLKFSRFGVLNWNNLMDITRNDPLGEIAALTFSYTEILRRPISYARAIKIIQKHKHCKPTFQSPYKIDNNLWEEFLNMMES